jgi:hypothetical protein
MSFIKLSAKYGTLKVPSEVILRAQTSGPASVNVWKLNRSSTPKETSYVASRCPGK